MALSDVTSVEESLRGLRGLGLLNLHQVYEGYGQYLAAGSWVARDPNAEQMLSTRGYTDSLAGTLQLVGGAGQAQPELLHDHGSGGIHLDLAADDGTGGLAVENPQVLQTLDALLASTTEALDSHLSASLKLGWLEEKDLLSASIARGEAAVGPTQEAAPESAAQRDGYSGAIIRPQALRAQSSATSAPPAPSASAASALGGWLSSVLPSRSAAAGAGAKSSSGGASGGNGAVNADGSEGQRWEGSRRAELAEEVRKINLVRFRSGSLPPLAQELAAVALPPNRWGAALPQAPIPALLVQRGSAGMGTGAGVERLAGAVPGAEAGGAEPLRLLYEALDCVICRADAGSSGGEAFRPENFFGLRGVRAPSPDQAQGAESVTELSAELQALQLRGSLRFLEDSYWVWLLKQVLPAIQAEDPGLVAVRADDSVGVRVVSAWVRWFLGDQPDHASWEMAAPSAGQVPVPLWPQVFFLLRTGHYQDAVALATRHSHHPTIKKALAAWVESGGMHRVGLIDTDGDGLLDDRLAQELDTEYAQSAVPGNDVWMRAVYAIVNERSRAVLRAAAPEPLAGAGAASGAHQDCPLDLRELPSLLGLHPRQLRALTAQGTASPASPDWGILWAHVQDILWRHLIFARPDADPVRERRFRLAPTPRVPGALGIQGHLSALLALGDDLTDGLVGIDAEIPRAALGAAPYIKPLAALLSLRFDLALDALDQLAERTATAERVAAPAAPAPAVADDPALEAAHVALVLDLYGAAPRIQGARGLRARLQALLARLLEPAAGAARRMDSGQPGAGSVTPGARTAGTVLPLRAAVHYCLACEPAAMGPGYDDARAEGGRRDADAVELLARVVLVAGPDAARNVLRPDVGAPSQGNQSLALEAPRRQALLLSAAARAAHLLLELRHDDPLLAARRSTQPGPPADRRVAASALFLAAADYTRSLGLVAELVADALAACSAAAATAPAKGHPAAADLASPGALAHWEAVRDFVQQNQGAGSVAGPLGCGPSVAEWVEQSEDNGQLVEAVLTLFLLWEAHQLHLKGWHAEALRLLTEGRQSHAGVSAAAAPPLSYHALAASWRSRSFVPLVPASASLAGRSQGAGADAPWTSKADLEAAAAEAAARVRALDPALAGAPAAYIKAQVYPTLLLAMRCLQGCRAQGGSGALQNRVTHSGEEVFVRSQAGAIDALLCQAHLPSFQTHAPCTIPLPS